MQKNAFCSYRTVLSKVKTSARRNKYHITQTLLVMKLTIVLLATAFLNIHANGLSQNVSFSGKDVGLEKVFAELKKQTGFGFFYKETVLNNTKPVTIKAENIPLKDFLDLLLKDQPLKYSIKARSVIITSKSANNDLTFDEQFLEELLAPIKGTVKDADGRPLAGASISVKGSKEAVVSDERGNFEINAKEGDVLVISYVGFERQELRVGKEGAISFVLKNKIENIDSVTIISTGYEKISKERFVGSYAQLDSANFHRRAGMGILERLDGTVPGVLFNKKGPTFPIQIRGISTIGSVYVDDDPLIIVDNFPMDNSFRLENINPNDVETVTVLKDAAATSIWGSRAGNGVIVITTKRGKYNQRFQMSLSSNVTIEEKPDLFYYPRISSSDFIDVEEFLFSKGFYDGNINNNSRPVISPVVEILARRRAGLITAADSATQIDAFRQFDVRNDLNEHVYREAIRQQHYLGFSGGNNTLAYQFSLGYNHSLNNIQHSKPDDQYTINTNTSFRPIKNLEIQAGINFVQGIANSYTPSFPSFSPYARLLDDNGNALSVPYLYRQGYLDTAGGGQLLDWNYRPMDEIRLANIRTNNKAFRLNLGVGYKLTSWLQATVNYQYSNHITTTRNLKSLLVFETRDLINQFTNPTITNNDNLRYPIPRKGILDVTSNQSTSYNLRGMLNVNKSWGGIHQLTALTGAEIGDSKGGFGYGERFYGYDDLIAGYRTNINYLTSFPKFYPQSSTGFIPAGSNGYSEQNTIRFVSVLANVGYSYKNRYSFYASARRDGANVFGVNTNNKWKPLGSIGAGWEISKEDFYRVSWLPYLKLRASYGYAGNVSAGLSGKFILTYISGVDQYTGYSYSQSGKAPNDDLRWEEVATTNVGLDFQLLKGRLSGSLETFYKRSKDVISTLPFAPTSGVVLFDANSANLKANGFEFSLNSKNTKGIIEWTSNFALSYAKTTITTDLKRAPAGGYKAQDYVNYGINGYPGRIAYGISSYRWAGLDPATGDPQGYLNGQVSKNYQGIFNDSVQNQVFHGSSLPLYSSFLRNNISWKGFTLSVNITGRFNYYFREPVLELAYSATVSGRSYAAEYYDRWQKPGDEAFTNVPSMSYPVSGSVSLRNLFYQNAEITVKRADNIRLQDVRLAYQWNNAGNRKLPFQSVQFFFYPNNLNWILWRAEDSRYDPDFSGGISTFSTAAPTPKTWTGGITINF